jgi:hypothetical protein
LIVILIALLFVVCFFLRGELHGHRDDSYNGLIFNKRN